MCGCWSDWRHKPARPRCVDLQVCCPEPQSDRIQVFDLLAHGGVVHVGWRKKQKKNPPERRPLSIDHQFEEWGVDSLSMRPWFTRVKQSPWSIPCDARRQTIILISETIWNHPKVKDDELLRFPPQRLKAKWRRVQSACGCYPILKL